MDRIFLFKCLLLWPTVVFALPQASSTAASTSTQTQPAFPTMSAQDGLGVPDGGVGSVVHPTSAPGSDGSNQGAFSLSTGAIVGLSIGIGLIILAVGKLSLRSSHDGSSLTDFTGGMWFLWYMAKKRQWNVRESIRRASRRVTGRKVPPKSTPSNKSRRGTVYANKSTSNTNTRDAERGIGRSQEPVKPTHGWLADEKERSRSRSREDEERLHKTGEQTKAAPGWKAKVPFGGR
jgi:hypothetical protein